MENQQFNPYQQQQNDNYVIQENLPNATVALVLGILSILGCCCYGIVGLILGIVGVILAQKDLKLYNANPTKYKGISALNTGKILSIIGIVLSVIYLLILGYIYLIYGIENYENTLMEWANQMQQESM